jgi:hypothetical protein
MGQFDVVDADTILGGEHMVLEDMSASESATEAYAADVGTSGGSGIVANSTNPQASLGARSVASIGGLSDDGTTNYGTLFGTGIGGTAGQGTALGTQSTRGVVTLGPKTHFGSGKVTLWHQAGLYGVTTDAVTASTGTNPIGAATAVNARLYALGAGTLSAHASTGVGLGMFVGYQKDRSLVSTTASAVGETATNDHIVFYYTGNAANMEGAA